MKNLKYKGYIGSVEYREEEDCYYGKVHGMSKGSITYEGKTLEDLKMDFEASVEEYIEENSRQNSKRK